MEQQTLVVKKEIKISYKQLYKNEKIKRELAETNLEQYKKEIEILKKLLEEKDKEKNKLKGSKLKGSLHSKAVQGSSTSKACRGSLSKKSLDFLDNLAEEKVKTFSPGSLSILPKGKLISSILDFESKDSKLKGSLHSKAVQGSSTSKACRGSLSKKSLDFSDNLAEETQRVSPGSQCSVSGNNYEKKIHNICKNCDINHKPFNTQKEEELAGSSSKNDIECNFINEKDIGIEIKKSNTPDWMQCSIKYNNKTNKWTATNKGKIPINCRELFNNLINNINLYDGEIPPFMKKSITHEEWCNIKKETNKWNDKYITIPSDSISKLYQEKNCNYIQISDGYGLYHLGKDICEFGVPLFNIEQQIRIRTKIHTKKNKKGFCCLSVTVACQPKDIKKLTPSKYSLDNKDKLPPLLIYKL